MLEGLRLLANRSVSRQGSPLSFFCSYIRIWYRRDSCLMLSIPDDNSIVHPRYLLKAGACAKTFQTILSLNFFLLGCI
jgi:hypothetical protein